MRRVSSSGQPFLKTSLDIFDTPLQRLDAAIDNKCKGEDAEPDQKRHE
jgi:hypothetical protein